MKIFGEIFSIFYCAILVAHCQNAHHIDQRILEDQYNANSSFSEDVQDNSGPFMNVTNLEEQSEAPISENTTLSSAPASSTPFNVTLLLRNNQSNESNQAGEEVSKAGVDTEVSDLLNQTHQILVENHQHPMDAEIPLHFPDKIDKQSERIEEGEKTEDELRRHWDEKVDIAPRGPLAVILITALVALSVLCYAALLIWRRYLENRYGSRTLLVNAEEIPDPSDLKHFSI